MSQNGVPYNLEVPTDINNNKNKKQKALTSLAKGLRKGNTSRDLTLTHFTQGVAAGLLCPQQWPQQR